MNAPAKMTRRDALLLVLRGTADDVVAYTALTELLQQQFDAALHHRSAQLSQLAAQVSDLVDAMDQRRRQRVSLVQALLGKGGTISGVTELLQGEARLQLEKNWAALQQMVPECKRLNSRNSELLSEQYSIMQRVLHGEEQIYAPG